MIHDHSENIIISTLVGEVLSSFTESVFKKLKEKIEVVAGGFVQFVQLVK